MVADQRLQPTFTADLAGGAARGASQAGAEGVLHLTAVGRVLVVRVHRGDHASRPGIDVPVEADRDHDPAGRRRPAAQRCAGPSAGGRARACRAAPLAEALDGLHGPGRAGRRSRRNRLEGGSEWSDLQTRLDGPILIAPRVLGDERGFFCETYRRTRLRRARDRRGDGPGQPLALRARDRARHALPDRARAPPSSCAAAAARSTTSSSTCASAPRPSASGRASSSPRRTCTSLYCPIGFAHGFCVLSEVADVMYKQSNYYADETERGHRLQRPRGGDRVAAADRGADPVRARRDGADPGRVRSRACPSSTRG